MQVINKELVQRILIDRRASKPFLRRFSFAMLHAVGPEFWKNFEIVGMSTKDGNAGVLLVELDNTLYATLYEMSSMSRNASGATKPIICDFCKTWQAGGRAGSITFRRKSRTLSSITLLCYLDLECSLYVRNMTAAAKTSRSQLREDVTTEYRIERLRTNLMTLVDRLSIEPMTLCETNVD